MACHCFALRLIAVHCRALPSIALYCVDLHCCAVCSSGQHCSSLNCIALHGLERLCIASHCPALLCVALHCAVVFCLTLVCTSEAHPPDPHSGAHAPENPPLHVLTFPHSRSPSPRSPLWDFTRTPRPQVLASTHSRNAPQSVSGAHAPQSPHLWNPHHRKLHSRIPHSGLAPHPSGSSRDQPS